MSTIQAPVKVFRIETPAGAATWRNLEWDSEQFGIPAARLDTLDASGSYAEARSNKRELLASVFDQCCQAGIRHLSTSVDTGDFTTIHALEEAGFELIDGIQTSLISLDGYHTSTPPGTRLFDPKNLPEWPSISAELLLYWIVSMPTRRFHVRLPIKSTKAGHGTAASE